MHKKIKENLKILAKDILEETKNIEFLKDKVLCIYEQLTLLHFVEKEIKETTVFEEKQIQEKTEKKEKNSLKKSLEEELKNVIPNPDNPNLFVRATKNVSSSTKSSKLPLEDKISFVTYLFNGNQEDFNRVFSQLNTFDSEEEAKDFILNIVKPDYNWEDKKMYEKKLLAFISKQFS